MACCTAGRSCKAASCSPAHWAPAQRSPAPPRNRSPSRSGAFIRAPSRRCCRHRPNTKRTWCARSSNPKGDARTQHARAPLQKLNGTITPNALHFTINHSGIPDIDPGQARAGHPRHGQAAAGIHRRRAAALPDGDAQAFRRMRRQQRADVLAGADPGAAAGAARPGVLRGMDRRAGVDAARRGRRRSEGDVDAGRGRGLRSRSAAACR